MTVLCADLGGSTLKLAVAEGGQFRAIERRAVTGSADDLGAVEAFARAHDLDAIDRVAIALPGVVLDGRLVSIHGKHEGLLGVDLDAWARERLGRPAIVENDARAALIGETASGSAAGAPDAAILVLGTGIGTAVQIDGVPLRGPHGTAGILGGHLTIDRRGPRCVCGNTGCAELWGGTWALPDRLRERLADPPPEPWARRLATGRIGFAELFEWAGDPVADAVLADALDAWAATGVALAHLVDPAVLVIAGGAARSSGLFLPQLERVIGDRIWGGLTAPRLVASAAPDLSVLRGLAALGTKENA